MIHPQQGEELSSVCPERFTGSVQAHSGNRVNTEGAPPPPQPLIQSLELCNCGFDVETLEQTWNQPRTEVLGRNLHLFLHDTKKTDQNDERLEG